MKTKILIFSLAVVALASCNSKKTVDTLPTKTDSLSYAIGLSVGTNFKQSGLDTTLNFDIFFQGVEESKDSNNTLLEATESEQFLQNYFRNLQMEASKQQEEKLKNENKDRIADQEAFLAVNKEKEGVQTTPSGLQYEILKEGNGPKPNPQDMVSVHYHGTLSDGTVFDSSVDRGEPAQFPVGQVIPGWVEALQLMPVGSKWKLVIPHNLAYGPQGRPSIPPYSALVFEVELLDIVKQ